MSAANGILAAPVPALSRRERMIRVLDHLACGLMDDDDATAAEDFETVSAAIDAVQLAGTEAEALAAYASCLLGLAGAEVRS